MTIETHLILVSAQPIPNLTPVLDETLRPKKVIMLVSPDMQQRSQYLESIYNGQYGIEVERHTVNDPWDLEAITLQVIDIVDNYPANSIALNATGGTKPMALAAFDVFQDKACLRPIFYVHPEKDRLIWLNPKQPAIELADKLRLKNYLMAYGAEQVEVEKNSVSLDLQDLTTAIIKDIRRYERALGSLNYLALNARNSLTATIEDWPLAKPELRELLELFEAQGLCQINGQSLRFKDETSRFIANGGWLELYTYKQCLNLKQSQAIQDIARNIEITRQSQTKNEIDIGLIKANRLHLIECKTKRYRDNNSADTLYKLDSLRDLIGGLQGKAMLVSFNQLDKPSRLRARELKIAVCCATELQHLQNRLKEWLENDR